MLSRLLPHILRPSVSPVLQRPRPINLRAACRSMAATSKKRPASPTGADKPQPDEIAPEAKRRHVEQDVPQPTQEGADEAKSKKEADDDWFKGMLYPRVSSVDAAEAKDAAPPLAKLEALLAESKGQAKVGKSDAKSVVFLLNMEDLRIEDNRALSLASDHAQEVGLPLVVVFAINPGDFRAHDRSPRRIDLVLRNVRVIQEHLEQLSIPLFVLLNSGPRKTLPSKLLDLVLSPALSANAIFSNLSYEVDELERDIRLIEEGREKGVDVRFVHDRLVVEPGGVQKKGAGGGPVTIYSPWFRTWTAKVNADQKTYLAERPPPAANDRKAYDALVGNDELKGLIEVPEKVKGFELEKEDSEMMRKLYPPGHEAALKILERFVTTQPRPSQIGSSSPLAEGAEEGKGKGKEASRLGLYADSRDRADLDSTSRLSPYLTSGIVSPRQVLNRIKLAAGTKSLPSDRKDPFGMWVGEVAWRDFYNHILAAFPRVGMGQPYNPKYRGIQWETDPATFQAWKDGLTGYPIVDAAMRQCKSQGWMHNRARMISSSFLVKDLMLDWRLGERHFMTSFIDGDLAANNGGWQWVASTGTDPAPYFRIFAPVSQSAKADPTGDYIRFFVPELRKLKGKQLYDPHGTLSAADFKKLGYPAPIVDHAKARLRALARFKTPGEKPDEEEGIDPTPPSPADDGKPVADLSRFGFKPDLKKETHSGSKGRQAEAEEVVFTGTSATPKAKKGTLDGFVKKG